MEIRRRQKIFRPSNGPDAAFPWRAIVGMRNRLVHAYFDVDTEMVWKTLQNEIPGLLRALEALIASDQG